MSESAGDRSSAMRDMSRAIRHELSEYGPTLQDIPEGILGEIVQVVGAFYLDLREEHERRLKAVGHEPDLARELGVRYAVRCTCGHLVVTSDSPIPVPQIRPCCRSGSCPYCSPEGEDSAEWGAPADGGDGSWIHDPERRPGFDVEEDEADL